MGWALAWRTLPLDGGRRSRRGALIDVWSFARGVCLLLREKTGSGVVGRASKISGRRRDLTRKDQRARELLGRFFGVRIATEGVMEFFLRGFELRRTANCAHEAGDCSRKVVGGAGVKCEVIGVADPTGKAYWLSFVCIISQKKLTQAFLRT